MVSPLWKACADGDVNNVDDLLKDATSVDIEIKGGLLSPPISDPFADDGQITRVSLLLFRR